MCESKKMINTAAVEEAIREATVSDDVVVDVEEAAEKTLQEFLNDSVIPKSLWPALLEWLDKTGLSDVYVHAQDAVGAWWGAVEAERLGYTINFGKACCIPSRWCPEGENWEIAQAEAKLKFVEDFQTMLANEALQRIET